MRKQVTVAVFEHRHGMEFRAFDSFEKAQAWKDEIGAEFWSNVSNDPQPEDPCGDEYFDLADGSWFYIEVCEVE